MKRFFKWISEGYRWYMFKWIWGLDKKQVTHIRERVEFYEPRFKTREYVDNSGHEITMEVSNCLF